MGEHSGISWCDNSWNPWIGCTKVSAGCANCYAEAQNRRYQWNPAGWGKGAPRKRTSAANWRKPVAWACNAKAAGRTLRIFCGSLCDFLDPEVDDVWRKDLFELIDYTGRIGGVEWLLLTKRIEEAGRLPIPWLHNPPNYVRLGVTVENQENVKRAELLLDVWQGMNFLSMEPLIESVTLRAIMRPSPEWADDIQWVIVGGESGAGCRPMNLDWAREIRDHCKRAEVPFFFKQIGGHPDKRHLPAGWPEDLRVQEFPKEEE